MKQFQLFVQTFFVLFTSISTTFAFSEKQLTDMLHELITNERCYASPRMFVACTQGLSRAYGDDTSWVPEPLVSFYKTQVRQEGPLFLVKDFKAIAPTEVKSFLKKSYRDLESVSKVEPRFDFESRRDEFFNNILVNVPDKKTLLIEVLNHYLDPIDRHTAVLSEKITKELRGERQSVVGIGVRVTKGVNSLKVVEVAEEGGAFEAGIKAGDEIIAVEGEPLGDFELESAVAKILGAENSYVKLDVKNSDGLINTFSVQRRKVTFRAASYQSMTARGLKIGVIKLRDFLGQDVCEQVSQKLSKAKETGIDHLVLDLRNNSGGSLQEAVCIGGLFIGQKASVITVPFDSKLPRTKETARSQVAIPGVHMSVLVNASSASASELLAGLIQDAHAGFIVGQRTYGKGSYQSLKGLRSGGAMKQTEGLYYVISGKMRSPQIYGVIPDFAVDETLEKADERLVIREEDYYGIVENPYPKPALERSDEVISLQKCIDETGQAKLQFKKSKDLQQETAIDLAVCMAPGQAK